MHAVVANQTINHAALDISRDFSSRYIMVLALALFSSNVRT